MTTEPLDGEAETIHAGRDIDQSLHRVDIGRDQNNADTINVFNAAAAALDSAMRSRRVTAETLSEQMRSYYATEELKSFVPVFAAHRHLVLVCPDTATGSGQRSAAAFLVTGVSQALALSPALPFQHLFPANDEALDAGLAGVRRTGLFMDAAEAGEMTTAEERLLQFGNLVERLPLDCYAVLAVPAALEREARRWFPHQVHRLVRPPDDVIFRRHTTEMEESVVDELLRHDWVLAELRDAWPPEAAALGDLTAQVWHSGFRQREQIMAELRGARSDWTDHAREVMRSHPTAAQRALLLAVAALEGAEPVTALRARDLLLSISDYPVESRHPLERDDIRKEFEAIRQAGIDGTALTFQRPKYGTSLLNLVWQEFPGLERLLRGWIDRLPTLIDPRDAAGLDRLAGRLAELAARQGSGELAFLLARQWARPTGDSGESPDSGTGDGRRRAAAALLLRAACLHPKIGGDTRRRAYTTAYHQGYSVSFRAVLAEAAGTFDEQHRATAMTRLKHLARGHQPEVREAVARAVLNLHADVPLDELLEYLTGWLVETVPARADVVVDIVLAVTADAETAGLPADPLTTSPFWTRALDVLPGAQASLLIGAWLSLGDGGDPERLIATLLAAAGNDLRRMGQLVYAAGNSSGEALGELLRQVRVRLDEVAPVRAGNAPEQPR